MHVVAHETLKHEVAPSAVRVVKLAATATSAAPPVAMRRRERRPNLMQ
jgi:hypothetical protein